MKSRRGPDTGELFAQAVARHQAGAVGEAEKLYRAVLQRDSGHLGARCNIALALHQAGRLDAAVKSYLWAVARGVTAAEIHNGLGMALQELGREDEAVAALRRGIAIQPGDASLFNSLGIAYRRQNRLGEALAAYGRTLAVEPAHVLARLNAGNAYREQGRLDQAIEAYRQCLRLRPDLGDAHHNLAMALLARGDFQEGWDAFEWRAAISRKAGRVRAFTGPEWQGESGAGQRLFLYAEEGIGDTIQFVRYARMAAERGFRVTLEVQEPLLRLVTGLPGIERVIAAGTEIPPYDLRCSLLSLPRVFRTDLATIPAEIPYLSADPAVTEAWRAKLADKKGLKVGIAWRGNPQHLRDRQRSLSLAWFLDRLDRPEIDIVSLQKDFAWAEFPKTSDKARFMEAGRGLADFADTAGLVANLDLVVTVDTSVCHLAGALGVPVWTLIDFANDWRWMTERADTPWYPSMRLFRQDRPGDWEGVARRLEDELSNPKSGSTPRRSRCDNIPEKR